MNINNFIKDNKYNIPENEIENIYIWSQISNTQEVLLPSKVYFELLLRSFKSEITLLSKSLTHKLPNVSLSTYNVADYLTFSLNYHRIFADTSQSIFAISNDSNIINSLTCYLAYIRKNYNFKISSIASLIINKIDNPEDFNEIVECEFLVLKDFAAIPDHKYKSPIIDTILSKRCAANKITLILVSDYKWLLNETTLSKGKLENYPIFDLVNLVKPFYNRRKYTNEKLLCDWISLIDVKTNSVVYSTVKPDVMKRIIDRHKQ